MKKLLPFLCVLSLCAGFGFAEDAVEGYWLSFNQKTGKVNAGWHVYQENDVLYGRILSIPDAPQDVKAELCKESYKGFPLPGKVDEMPVCGTPWIFGLKMVKAGEWAGGNIIDPNDGNMYKCKITFRPADGKKYKADTLEMRGEIGMGLGRSEYWQRCTKEEAAGLR